jgi:hypothetical protein
MGRRFLLPTLLLATTLPGWGQITIGGPGIGYPGGGRRYPQGGQRPPNQPNDQNSASSLTGILRKIDDKDVIIESDDQTITTVSTPGSTKYSNSSGGNAKIGDFQPGDHVRISTTRDGKGNYKAQSMSMVKEGTLDEHAAASQAADDPTHPITKPTENSASKDSSSSSSASDRPKLRRASSSSDDSTSSTASPGSDSDRPKLRRSGSGGSSSSDTASTATTTAATTAPSSNDPSSSSTVAPRRRAVQPSSTQSAASAQPDSVTPRDSDDSGPPKLRRTPAPDSAPPAEVADARPSLHADDAGGVTRLPPPPAEAAPIRMRSSGDEVIDRAREAAFSYSETLPNYVVKQFTTRYQTALARGGRTSWETLDVVTADVIEENGVEKYKNILVGGKPPKGELEESGSWSSGEFSSLLLSVMSPSTQAEFHGKRSTTILNRDAYRYDYSVEQANSRWHVEAKGQSYMPAYTGSVWIDRETGRVLRLELAGKDMPRGFPLDTVESAIDYDFVLIGDTKYLLPVHSEILSCARGTNDCGRNVIEFRNYRKFTAETSITFDGDK